jgi:hypothetical protein
MTFLSCASICAKKPFQGTNIVTLLLSPTGSPGSLKEPMGTDGLASFCLYTIPCFFTSHISACCLLHAVFLLGLLFNPEVGGNIYLWITDLLLQITQHYILEDKLLITTTVRTSKSPYSYLLIHNTLLQKHCSHNSNVYE